jgi:cysteine-rich repeat protein
MLMLRASMRLIVPVFFVMLFFVSASFVHANISVSTTTLFISICGDTLVNEGEECDIPGEIGTYSTTIVGRQCGTNCLYGPYCGDGVLQTLEGEACDDANNADNDFCAADCSRETADSGGGSTGGGGSSGSGGRDEPMGDTQVTITGKAFPNATVNILIDGDTVGTVRTNSRGEFQFTTATEPGTASFSFWATDSAGTRCDLTQGAVTSLNGIMVPPTLRASTVNVNPGDTITLSGQTMPSVTVEVSIDNGKKMLTTASDALGAWSIPFDTGTVSVDTHTLKARFIAGTGTLKTESPYGTVLSLFVGVEGKATSNADLNRDGKVNLIDFSILVFWWGTPGGNSNPPADINQNGKVGLEDFSILLFNWTG